MTHHLAALLSLAVLVAAAPAAAQDPPPPPKMPGSFEQIGHNPLMNRGMNAALAVLDGYAYVGSRTDGTHANAGVMVVDVRDPAKPQVVHEIGPADGEGLPTQTSRELRVLPDQKLLLILNHQCSELIHRCATPSSSGRTALPSNIKVFDIAGANAARPKLVSTFFPSSSRPQTPHEFFVWTDPKKPSRVLVYYTDPSTDPEVKVADFSRAREGQFSEIAAFSVDAGGGIHSLTVSNDGRRVFLAALTGGYIAADASEVAAGLPSPKLRQLTAPDDAPTWDGPGAHSAIRVPGTSSVMITDEVYGFVPGLLSNHGCPWGWVRFVDESSTAKPVVVSEYKLPVNEKSYCDQVPTDRNSASSWAAHNPTLTEHLAILSWHSAGLQAIDTSDPRKPAGAANWSPTPLPAVQTEDPLLSSGRDKVVVWSFPVVVNGLIYVVDLRNGLYVLRYTGPYEREVSGTKFLDGNSNSGDVARLEPAEGVASRPGAPEGAGPAVGGPPPCLAAPLRLRGARLGPFALGMTRGQAELRGGPPSAVRRASVTWCVEGGGRSVAVFRRGKVAFVGATRGLVGAPRALTPGRRGVRSLPRGTRRARGGLVYKRGRGVTLVARVRGRTVRFTGIARGKPSARELARLAKAAGL